MRDIGVSVFIGASQILLAVRYNDIVPKDLAAVPAILPAAEAAELG
jgi:hypothetical protein